MLSRHPLQRIQSRDISQLSRHQLRRIEVATSFSGRDISNEEQWSRHQSGVATSVAKKLRSRRHLVVATSEASKEGRDVIQLSRHQLQWEPRSRHQPVVATLVTKEERSRQQSEVATSDASKESRDNSHRSRHLLHRPEGHDNI